MPEPEPDPIVHFQLTTNNVPQKQCVRELSSVLPEAALPTVCSGTHGIRCTAPSSQVHALAALTIPERVYAIVCDVPSSTLPDDDTLIPMLKELITSAGSWPSALQAHRRLHPSASGDCLSFAVKAERRGRRFKQRVSSLGLGGCLGAALHRHFGWRVDLRAPMLEVSVTLNDDSFFVSIALLRRLDSVECRTVDPGLNPHVAWAMVRCLGELRCGSLVCDPMCGRCGDGN